MTRRQSVYLGSGSIAVLLTGILHLHAVGKDLTSDDKEFIPYYLTAIKPLPEQPDYEQQLAYILAVQHAVLAIAPLNSGLPEGQLREPMQLYQAGTGQCYDRSRVIEKILNNAGFETRHIFILGLGPEQSPLRAMITPGVSSHAVTEVLTRESWLVVDSNTDWVALDADRLPVSIEQMRSTLRDPGRTDWYEAPPTGIYNQPFTYLYGLHSRHGRFYPPFDLIPDVHYGEFISNVF